MEAALRVALDRHGFSVESAEVARVVEAVVAAAPDLVLLVGDATSSGGTGILRHLAENPMTAVVPVALLASEAPLDARVDAFRSGAVAVIPRGPSADAIAREVARLAHELPERPRGAVGEIGDTTLDEIVAWVSKELRRGILSVETKDEAGKPAPMRVVLGAGMPVADALAEFVQKLRPHVAKAEPIKYEFHEALAGRLGLLDGELGRAAGDVAVFDRLRVLLLDDDPGRADVLAQALREHGALVAVGDVSTNGLSRGIALDPDVIVLDAERLEDPGFDLLRAMRGDPRLRFASLLLARWDELFPAGSPAPDLEQLAARIAPLTEADRLLAVRVAQETAFETRLELTGPSRLVRTVTRVPGTFHVTVRNPRATIELDLADGLVAGAQGLRQGAEGESAHPLEGLSALSALLALGSGRVRVERRSHPTTANLMTPGEEALAAASREPSAVPRSILPPKDSSLSVLGVASRSAASMSTFDDDVPSLIQPVDEEGSPDAIPPADTVRGGAPARTGAAPTSPHSAARTGHATRLEAETAPASASDLSWDAPERPKTLPPGVATSAAAPAIPPSPAVPGAAKAKAAPAGAFRTVAPDRSGGLPVPPPAAKPPALGAFGTAKPPRGGVAAGPVQGPGVHSSVLPRAESAGAPPGPVPRPTAPARPGTIIGMMPVRSSEGPGRATPGAIQRPVAAGAASPPQLGGAAAAPTAAKPATASGPTAAAKPAASPGIPGGAFSSGPATQPQTPRKPTMVGLGAPIPNATPPKTPLPAGLASDRPPAATPTIPKAAPVPSAQAAPLAPKPAPAAAAPAAAAPKPAPAAAPPAAAAHAGHELHVPAHTPPPLAPTAPHAAAHPPVAAAPAQPAPAQPAAAAHVQAGPAKPASPAVPTEPSAAQAGVHEMRTPVPEKHPMLVMDETEATVIGDSMALVREGLRSAPEAATPAAPAGPAKTDVAFSDTLAPGMVAAPSVPQAAPVQVAPVAAPRPAPASPAAVAPSPAAAPARPAPTPLTQSGENVLSTGEHTLIIPRSAMEKTGGGSSIARVLGLSLVVLAVVAGAAVAGLYAAGVRPSSFARPGGNAPSAANPPEATPPPTAPSVPTAATAAVDASAAAPVDAAVAAVDAGAAAVDASVLALADAAAQVPVDAAVAAAPAPVDAAVAAAPAPTPATTANVAGITPDSELPRDRADAADVLVEDALRLMQAGNLDAAGLALDHSLELDHVNPQGYEAMSRYRVLRRQFPEAIAAAERACELRSSQSRYVVQLGDALAASGDVAGARRAWQRAVAMDRNRDARARLEQNPGP